MAKKTELAIEATTSVLGYADTIISTVELAASVAIPLSQFIPLIKDVSDIFSKVADLYRSAQHNKNITGILMERISAANTSVGILQAREDLLNSNYYKSLQRLVRVLRNMKKFIEDITQYNTVQKFLGAKKIESEFKELCKEYDSSMTSLNFNLLVVNFNTETEDKIVKEDVEQLIKFQEALVESMNNVEQKVSHTNDQMNLVVERVSEMAITMQNMQRLNFLNSVKMVHRDIRSENIVITDHEIAKITNFKFSRRFDEATSNIAVNKECVRYSAPEMLRRGISGEKEKKDKYSIKYDTKCEVYSFGILLWEIAERKIPYEQFEDFMEVTRKVVGGYRESFTTGTDIPKKYQDLVNKSVDPNPGSRPIFSRMLTVLQDIFRNPEEPTSRHNSIKAIKAPPERKMTQSTIAAAEDCIINFNSDLDSFNADWDSFDYMTLDKAIEYHKNDSKDKQKLYKCFDTYAEMDNPRAKYWKAYYISKGWSNLKCSDKEKQELSVQLFKEAADYGDEIPDAQLRYATMVMQGKGVKQDKAYKESGSVYLFRYVLSSLITFSLQDVPFLLSTALSLI
ncbi:unnamed protein product [Rhizophagus irregularis]|nr:unnamed protein product [Rhizophagus irregularis]